jgi:hypothetical protein
MTGSTVSGNVISGVLSNGGGIAVIGSGTARIENSIISFNSVSADGGGIAFAGAELRMSNVTVSQNTANAGNGGGLRLAGSGSIVLRNVTVAANTGSGGSGGGIYSDSGTNLTLANTVIGGNNSPSGRDFYAQNTIITRLTANIVQFGITDGGGNTIGGGGTIQQVNPQFQTTAPASNGGQVQTIALQSTSPAIDAGTNGEALDTNGLPLTTDARGAGFSRVRDGDGNGSAIVDLGAFEFPVAPPTAASVTVGGRVLNVSRRGIAGATVTLFDSSGNTRAARTNSFGFYRFADVAAGETYILQVRHKRFAFVPQVLTVTEETDNLNFTPAP